MPIYGYACNSCDHRFDALQKMSDPRLTDCPECGEAALRKQLSAPKFRLKGEGWYETDFKTGDKRNLAGESDKSDKSEKTAKSDSDSTSKDTSKKDKTPAKAEAKKPTSSAKASGSEASSA